MVQHNKGKIFLAEERGHQEIDWFRSYNTFNFGHYNQAHKTPFGPLYVLNDDTLAGGKSISMTVEADSVIVLIPVVGTIAYTDSCGHANYISAGECQLYTTPKDTTIQISNPYQDELVNFLQIWLHASGTDTDNAPLAIAFDIINKNNQVVPIPVNHPHYKFSIGKFQGRQESVYKLSDTRNGLFAFVIQGAFEVQYRLLHPRDGLALWEAPEVEWEALSNEAIILVMEIPFLNENDL
ncbi:MULTISPECIES: pirin family protein [Niastella]|uniref:Pirin family protein n=1 Tax=Niastella soli TaxID=2821487 RepID=A0ABS3Z615_9BACT|nr:pirin family protein [Niastella soli]MBO9205212.1 pirin family protein [Niastella soli]